MLKNTTESWIYWKSNTIESQGIMPPPQHQSPMQSLNFKICLSKNETEWYKIIYKRQQFFILSVYNFSEDIIEFSKYIGILLAINI